MDYYNCNVPYRDSISTNSKSTKNKSKFIRICFIICICEILFAIIFGSFVFILFFQDAFEKDKAELYYIGNEFKSSIEEAVFDPSKMLSTDKDGCFIYVKAEDECLSVEIDGLLTVKDSYGMVDKNISTEELCKLAGYREGSHIGESDRYIIIAITPDDGTFRVTSAIRYIH